MNCLDTTSPDPRVSDRYQFVSTGAIVQRFRDEGFALSSVQEARTGNPYSMHMVHMRHPGNFGEEAPELVIINSHNRTRALRVGLGFIRFKCMNGLIAGDLLADTGKMIHTGDNMAQRVMEYLDHSVKNISEKVRLITEMKTLVLSDSEIDAFNTQASSIIRSDGACQGDLTFARRVDDRQNTLWNVFNCTQENAIKGGYTILDKNGKVRRARPLTNVSRNVQVNVDLWKLAESFI